MSRGLLTALLLVVIALACIAAARRFERERRLLGKLRQRAAFDAGHALAAGDLNDDERDTAADLKQAGVLRDAGGGACYIDPETLASFRRKRMRFAFSGALGALAIAALVAVLVLGR
jgi:hypothetical protein